MSLYFDFTAAAPLLLQPVVSCIADAGGKPEKGGGPYNTVLGSDLVYAATPMETIHHCKGLIDIFCAIETG
jgi:hypothetical protein